MYLQRDGTIVVHLVKAMYGLKEASMEFHRHLSDDVPVKLGYVQSKNDVAMFYKQQGRNVQIITTHVDDLGLFGTKRQNAELKENLRKSFRSITVEDDPDRFQYLGLAGMRAADGSIMLNQPGFIEKIVKAFELEPDIVSDVPYGTDLFEIEEDDRGHS